MYFIFNLNKRGTGIGINFFFLSGGYVCGKALKHEKLTPKTVRITRFWFVIYTYAVSNNDDVNRRAYTPGCVNIVTIIS